MNARIVTRLAAVMLFLVCAAAAQYVQHRAVRGMVKFHDGEPVRGAAVQLKNMKTLDVRSFVTQSDGQFHFESLSTSVDYELRARYRGKFGPAKTLSQFSSRELEKVDLTVPE